MSSLSDIPNNHHEEGSKFIHMGWSHKAYVIEPPSGSIIVSASKINSNIVPAHVSIESITIFYVGIKLTLISKVVSPNSPPLSVAQYLRVIISTSVDWGIPENVQISSVNHIQLGVGEPSARVKL